ncbi:3-deoxy-7-phosphoheptulonate synthase [candidate division KSB1 bacterium]|nr:3-deoxy-7-phosphoheptulonate synthase [candidate division KSB1 bacterium]
MKKKGSEKKHIQVADVIFGGDELAMIVGPCAVENEQQLMAIANKLKKLGIRIIRASLFKPRTSPHSFQGLGLDGIPILRQVKQETGLLIESEIMDVRKLDILCDHVDILRVGTRNMQNYDLLKEIGKIDKPVILKRGFCSTIKEFICAAEYIFAGGNDKVIFCERGIRTFETAYRFTLDLAAVDILKRETPFPVIVDPSHAAGKRELVLPLCRAAVAAGADGLMIEMHPNPEKALSDGSQSMYPHQMKSLLDEVYAIKKTCNRSAWS